jgi:glycerophosphoryl diester phosphodiesterase
MVVGGYCNGNLVFFSDRQVEIWGHRGWPVRYPDNVLAGIRAAAAAATRVEIDLRRSRDGELVLSHDPDLGGKAVAETSWAELSKLDLGDGHPPITLEDLLALAPEVVLNIEIKNLPVDSGFDPFFIVVDEVAELCRADDVISSFHWPTVDHMRSLRPEVATGLLFESMVSMEDAFDHATRFGHNAIVPNWELVTPAVIERAHTAGLQVVCWTVDDPVVAHRLAGWGIDAIITNDPGAIAAFLDSVG